MTDNPTADFDPIQFVKHVVALWPSRTATIEGVPGTLRPYLAKGFETVDLHNSVELVANVDKVEAMPQGGAIVYFYDEANFLQRAVLERAGSGAWALRSLKFQCPICFGTGENYGATCTMCGGSGWGAS